MTLQPLWALMVFFSPRSALQMHLSGSERSEPSGANGYMDPGSEPGYTRPSHEDGTFTTANSLKLDIIIFIYIYIYYIIT